MIDSIIEHYLSFLIFYKSNTLLFWIITIELFPVFFMMMEILKWYIDKTVKKCVDNKTKENRVASYLYFFKDLGPNTASFSIVTLIVDLGKDDGLQTSTVWILTIVFFVGIMLKEKSRDFISLFYKELEKQRNLKWEQSLEH